MLLPDHIKHIIKQSDTFSVFAYELNIVLFDIVGVTLVITNVCVAVLGLNLFQGWRLTDPEEGSLDTILEAHTYIQTYTPL